MTPNNPLRIGDITKFLPDGMYLHKKYNHQLFHSIAKMSKTADAQYIEKRNKEIDDEEESYRKETEDNDKLLFSKIPIKKKKGKQS